MFQLSLRSLLVAVAFVALTIVSLRFASEAWWTLVLTIAAIALCAAMILAIVDRGERQAFAIGFVVAMLGYGLVLQSIPKESTFGSQGHQEFNPDVGRLPTTLLLRPIYHLIADIKLIDFSTGKPVANAAAQVGGGLGGGGMGSANYSMSESPPREVFMKIGHAWWAILLGVCGGLFARWVYRRRTREPLAAR
jgi:hypothetical protein